MKQIIDAHEPAQPPEHVQGMDRRQYIEEGTVGIGRKIQALRAQLPPRQILAQDEEHSQPQGGRQPESGGVPLGRCPPGKYCDATAGELEVTLLASRMTVFTKIIGG